MKENKKKEKPEKNLTENLPSTTTSRTDLPTKRRRLPTKPEPVKTYKVIDHEADSRKGQQLFYINKLWFNRVSTVMEF